MYKRIRKKKNKKEKGYEPLKYPFSFNFFNYLLDD